MPESPIADFDVAALYAALEEKRLGLGLSWGGVAKAVWNLSEELNSRRHDHPLSPATFSGMRHRRDISCQHALFMLRWLGRTPESFLAGAPPHSHQLLPHASGDRRLRWNLKALYEALDEQRRERTLTWTELAKTLGCTPSQLTGLRRAKFTAGMNVAMHIVQWLDRPSSDFIYASLW